MQTCIYYFLHMQLKTLGLGDKRKPSELLDEFESSDSDSLPMQVLMHAIPIESRIGVLHWNEGTNQHVLTLKNGQQLLYSRTGYRINHINVTGTNGVVITLELFNKAAIAVDAEKFLDDGGLE